MSLVRLALVIGSVVSYWIVCTAPAQAAQAERPKQSSNELTMGLLVNILSVPKFVCLVFAVLETVATLSFYFPDQQVPLLICSFRGPRLPDPPSAPFVAASILCMMGGFIRFVCYRTLGKFFTFNLSIRKSHALVTTGPYAYVRHPSYTGAFLANLAAIMHLFPESWMQTSGLGAVLAVRAITGMWAMYTFILVASCCRRIPDEDKLMKKTFGKEWEDWAARVKYRLIPGVY